MARKRKSVRRQSGSARALADPRYRLRVVRNRKRYTRKGRDPQGRGPFDSVSRSLERIDLGRHGRAA
ncbi:MAG: hypothetical protein GDA49_06650 [Rhodospirillales bacterium]|nr:hypothetical protein [Rhodospirillales bacterium]